MRWYLIGLAAALCARHATSNDSVLDVTRPRAGDAVTVGSEVEVAWAATGDTSNACSNASLALYRNGDLYSAITSSPEASPYVDLPMPPDPTDPYPTPYRPPPPPPPTPTLTPRSVSRPEPHPAY